MPIAVIFGIVIGFAAICGYAGYLLRGGPRTMAGLAGIGAVVAVLAMRLCRVF